MSKSNSIRVALFPETAGNFSGWIAQCLDFDLITQGHTIKAAQQSFQRTLIGHVALSVRRNQNPFFFGVLVNPRTLQAKAQPPVDLGKIRIAYSQLERPHTIPAV